MTPEEYLAGDEEAQKLFAAVTAAIAEIGPATIHPSKSQIAFRRQRNFAWVWRPGKYLKGKVAPLVLTLVFTMRSDSARWKEIVEPKPGSFTHHLELYTPADVDDEVRDWLRAAWEAA
jgi:hypothetical protein